MIVEFLGSVEQVHDQMETGIKDNTKQLEDSLLVQDFSGNDDLVNFHFYRVNWREVADNLFLRLQSFF